jgi:hypothetical protein
MVLIAPQQIVLLIQALGVIVAAIAGAYPDGYVPVPGSRWASFWFIIGDQAALLLLCLSHSIELFIVGPLNRAYARHEARLQAEKEARRQAEEELEKYKETEFWVRLSTDMPTPEKPTDPPEPT